MNKTNKKTDLDVNKKKKFIRFFQKDSMVLLTKFSRKINLKDPRIRLLLTHGFAFISSIIFSYLFLNFLTKYFDPTYEERRRAKLSLKKCNLSNKIVKNLNQYELYILNDLINPKDINISWNDIGGLNNIISDIRQTIIYPLQHPELFNRSKLLTISKGVLLYGPPGCGKTLIAKAIAKEAGANFINLQV